MWTPHAPEQSRSQNYIYRSLPHFFFFFTLSCSHWEAQTKPGGHSSVLLITYEHSSESRMSQIQTCCHPQLCFCLDFKSNSSENCSCRSSTSGYTDNGHWAPNRCELQVTRRVRFHFNQKLTFKHAVMSSPSLKKNIPSSLSKTWLKSEGRKAFQQPGVGNSRNSLKVTLSWTKHKEMHDKKSCLHPEKVKGLAWECPCPTLLEAPFY